MIKTDAFASGSFREILKALVVPAVVVALAVALIYRFADPAPPAKLIISTGEADSNYQEFAERYKEIIKADGVDVEIRPSKGGWDNLRALEDPQGEVVAGFVQDGLGDRKKNLGVSSLGSLGYEPVWIVANEHAPEITRLSEMTGRRVAMGEKGGEAHSMAKRLLTASGVDEKSAQLFEWGAEKSAAEVKAGSVDYAFFVSSANSPFIQKLLREPSVRLVSLEQADGITRQFRYLHHLVLPKGTLDLKNNIPAHDIDLVAPTATLMVRNTIHPALVYLLMKAASKVHREPGIFAEKKEFPIDKDFIFPLHEGAKEYYKNGAPFWLRYLPFWLAILVERFIFLVIPFFALFVPIMKMVPQFFSWRIRTQIYHRYGELKHLENQIKPDQAQQQFQDYMEHLDRIEARVNAMKVPLDFSDHIYVLREHIDFVRARLQRSLGKSGALNRTG